MLENASIIDNVRANEQLTISPLPVVSSEIGKTLLVAIPDNLEQLRIKYGLLLSTDDWEYHNSPERIQANTEVLKVAVKRIIIAINGLVAPPAPQESTFSENKLKRWQTMVLELQQLPVTKTLRPQTLARLIAFLDYFDSIIEVYRNHKSMHLLFIDLYSSKTKPLYSDEVANSAYQSIVSQAQEPMRQLSGLTEQIIIFLQVRDRFQTEIMDSSINQYLLEINEFGSRHGLDPQNSDDESTLVSTSRWSNPENFTDRLRQILLILEQMVSKTTIRRVKKFKLSKSQPPDSFDKKTQKWVTLGSWDTLAQVIELYPSSLHQTDERILEVLVHECCGHGLDLLFMSINQSAFINMNIPAWTRLKLLDTLVKIDPFKHPATTYVTYTVQKCDDDKKTDNSFHSQFLRAWKEQFAELMTIFRLNPRQFVIEYGEATYLTFLEYCLAVEKTSMEDFLAKQAFICQWQQGNNAKT